MGFIGVFPFQAYIFFKNQDLHLKGAFLIELPPFLFLQKIGFTCLSYLSGNS
jgi:hypothetical protein